MERGEKFGNDRRKERHFSPLCDSIFFAVPDREWKRRKGITMRATTNTIRDSFASSSSPSPSSLKGAILSGIADARICFQSIRKLVDREATERALVED